MHESERDRRLQAERAALAALQSASSLFVFDSQGDPPVGYTLTFRGRGLARIHESGDDVGIVQLHRIRMKLPPSYPDSGPAIHWLTPIFHPNVSSSGFVNLRAIELPWSRELGLDMVVERLWDLARGAYRNDGLASNFAARNWFRNQSALILPVDARPLCDRTPPSNVIKYQRRGAARGRDGASAPPGEVIYIDDKTPIPGPAPGAEPHRDAADGNNVLYIGDE
jgi:hypothetical protein